MEKEIKKCERASVLMAKKFAGILTPAQEVELTAWKNECPENAVLYDKWMRKSYVRESYKKFFSKDHSGLKNAMEKRIRSQRHSKLLLPVCGSAAVVAIVLTLSLFNIPSEKYPVPGNIAKEPTSDQHNSVTLLTEDGTIYFLDENAGVPEAGPLSDGIKNNGGKSLDYSAVASSLPVRWHIVKVPPGAEFDLVLADGTKVFLNSGSFLKYPNRFEGESREVTLVGEAYMEVSKRDAIFVVHTDNFDLSVLGTSFNINSYLQNDSATATLEEGIIRISLENGEYDLVPGKQFRIDKTTGEASVRSVDTELYTSWRKGYYRFEDATLKEIMGKLSLWYNVGISFANPSAGSKIFTGKVKKHDDILILLEGFRQTNLITYEIDGDKIIIR